MLSDLEANQRGELSESQRSQLRTTTLGHGLNEILPWPIAGAMVVGLIYVPAHLVSPDRLPPLVLAIMSMIAIVFLLPVRKPLRTRWQVMKDLAGGVVAHDEGTAVWGRTQYVGVVNGERMRETEPKQYGASRAPRV